MITGIAFLLILTAVAARGGKLVKLADIRPRHAWTVMAAVAIQFVIITLLARWIPQTVAEILHLGSYGLALAFVAFNWRIPGIAVVVAGGAMNLTAIVANGGVMPATAQALEFAGKATTSAEFENSTTQDDARLTWLGDVFAFPEGMPFANVFSLGDIVLVVGGWLLVSRQCLKNPEIPSLPATSGGLGRQKVVAAGWYPDPTRRFMARWWSGSEWTTHVRGAGTAAVGQANAATRAAAASAGSGAAVTALPMTKMSAPPANASDGVDDRA